MHTLWLGLETIINNKLSLKTNVITYDTNNIAITNKFNLYETILNNNIKNNLQYSKIEVDTLISNLIDNAPASLDTIKELAEALNNDEDYASTTQK